jgi:hypothetical protein
MVAISHLQALLEAGEGTISMTNIEGADGGSPTGNLTLSAENIEITGNVGSTNELNIVNITSVNSLTLNGLYASTVNIETTGTNSEIVLASGGIFEVGGDIVISATGNVLFLNSDISFFGTNNTIIGNELNISNAVDLYIEDHWFINLANYNNSPYPNITPNKHLYGCNLTTSSTCGGRIVANNNYLIYNNAPVLNVTPNSYTVNYGDVIDQLGPTYTLSGYIANDGLTDSSSTDTITGSVYYTSNYVLDDPVGVYNLTTANNLNNALTSRLGYTFNFQAKNDYLTVVEGGGSCTVAPPTFASVIPMFTNQIGGIIKSSLDNINFSLSCENCGINISANIAATALVIPNQVTPPRLSTRSLDVDYNQINAVNSKMATAFDGLLDIDPALLPLING